MGEPNVETRNQTNLNENWSCYEFSDPARPGVWCWVLMDAAGDECYFFPRGAGMPLDAITEFDCAIAADALASENANISIALSFAELVKTCREWAGYDREAENELLQACSSESDE